MDETQHLNECRPSEVRIVDVFIRNKALDISRQDGTWSAETQQQAFARSSDFTRRFLTTLQGIYPDVFSQLLWLQYSANPDSIYAIYDVPIHGVALQLDDGLICVWSARDDGGEYADWGDGRSEAKIFQEALDHFAACLGRGR